MTSGREALLPSSLMFTAPWWGAGVCDNWFLAKQLFPTVTGNTYPAVLLFVCFPSDTQIRNIDKYPLCGRKWPKARAWKEKVDPVPALRRHHVVERWTWGWGKCSTS